MDSQTPSVQDRILIAAVQVVGETGAGHLTLDRVAASAGVSKGGLLYHFSNKRALIEGMIARVLADFQHKVAGKISQMDNTANQTLKASIQVLSEQTAAEKSQLRALLAAAAENPGLLEPARNYLQEQFNAIRGESGEPDAALIILLAVEGIRFMELFDLLPLGSTEVEQMLGKLWDMSVNIK